MKKMLAIITILVLLLSLAPMALAADVSYCVAGTTSLCGVEWDISQNQMVSEGGIFTITFTDVAAGTHEFKVVKDSNWSTCWPSGNYVLTTDKTCDVTINFDPSDNSISVLLDGAALGDSYVVAGDSGLCNGINWSETNNTNQMIEENGVYKITFQDVMPGDYGFKVVKNGSWDTSWPPSNYNITVEAVSNVTITFDPSDNSITPTITPTGQQVEIVNKYVVAGDEALVGENWAADSENNQMTEENGVYTITFQDVAAGTYGFKVVKNGSWASSWPGDNYAITLEAASDVTITFDPSDNSIDVDVVVNGAVVPDTYVVAGSAGLCGSEWNATDTANRMTETQEGVYSITYADVAAGEYELKVVVNGSNWIGGADGNNVKVFVSDPCDVTVTYSADGIAVTGDHVSLTGNPTTGDAFDLLPLCTILVLSGALLVTLMANKKRFF